MVTLSGLRAINDLIDRVQLSPSKTVVHAALVLGHLQLAFLARIQM